MTILFACTLRDAQPWLTAFKALDPATPVRAWPDIGDPAAVRFVITWQSPPGLFARLPNLGAVSSLGAGAEAMLANPEIPGHIPLVRVVDTNLTGKMTEYVVLHVLRQHRELDRAVSQQRAGQWLRFPTRDTARTTVGFLGMGTLGQHAAAQVNALGFRVRGWTREARVVAGVETFHGRAMLPAFLEACDYLVCLLPQTPETAGIVDAALLAALPPGAHFINAGRGGQVVEADLLAALDSGRLASATLDVFATEPLPADHRFWSHPRVTITPHNAADSSPESVVPQMLDNYRRLKAGMPLLNQVDRSRGY